jgi:hypothetical protein
MVGIEGGGSGIGVDGFAQTFSTRKMLRCGTIFNVTCFGRTDLAFGNRPRRSASFACLVTNIIAITRFRFIFTAG